MAEERGQRAFRPASRIEAAYDGQRRHVADVGSDDGPVHHSMDVRQRCGSGGVVRLHRLSGRHLAQSARSEEHTSELQSLMRISYAVFCLKKKTKDTQLQATHTDHRTSQLRPRNDCQCCFSTCTTQTKLQPIHHYT